jgi:hypothetical protein
MWGDQPIRVFRGPLVDLLRGPPHVGLSWWRDPEFHQVSFFFFFTNTNAYMLYVYTIYLYIYNIVLCMPVLQGMPMHTWHTLCLRHCGQVGAADGTWKQIHMKLSSKSSRSAIWTVLITLPNNRSFKFVKPSVAVFLI